MKLYTMYFSICLLCLNILLLKFISVIAYSCRSFISLNFAVSHCKTSISVTLVTYMCKLNIFSSIYWLFKSSIFCEMSSSFLQTLLLDFVFLLQKYYFANYYFVRCILQMSPFWGLPSYSPIGVFCQLLRW